jgi:hypothetical protein
MVKAIQITVVEPDVVPKAIAISYPASPAVITIAGVGEPAGIKLTVAQPDYTPKAIVISEPAPPPIAITVGIQGPPGIGSPLYLHEQAAADLLWVINHNLGHRPIIELFTTGGLGMDGSIVHINSNQTQVQFASPIAGYATLA